jgi:hypothetical protein
LTAAELGAALDGAWLEGAWLPPVPLLGAVEDPLGPQAAKMRAAEAPSPSSRLEIDK